MYKLEPIDYFKIEPFLHKNIPNITVLYAIVDRLAQGEIWVDSLESISTVFVNTSLLFSFLLGKFIPKVVKMMSIAPSRYIYIQDSEVDNLELLFGKTVEFIEYTFAPDSEIQVGSWLKQLQEKYKINKIIKNNFDKCSWSGLIKQIYGNEDKFFDTSYGFCITDGNDVVCEAYAGYVARNYLEVATVTNDKYRGQNLSTILCAHLSLQARELACFPIWTCEKANKASSAVAMKLGYRETRQYTLREVRAE